MKHQEKLKKDTFNPEAFVFIDLGLPSGRLWATENAPGYYSYNEAMTIFSDHLPQASAIVELIEECKCAWNDEKKGLDIIGPNGNGIFLPAAGRTLHSSDVKYNNIEGAYWTRMPGRQTCARSLNFYSSGVDPLDNYYRYYGFSVRLCRESH